MAMRCLGCARDGDLSVMNAPAAPGALSDRHDPALVDAFGRRIDYVRLSVTDRCDFRCRYCMGEDMRFMPRSRLMPPDMVEAVAAHMVARGIRRIRLTGGEPLVRGDLPDLAARLGRLLGQGLEELTLTTNGARLAGVAARLADAGIRRVNVSLDTLDPVRFASIARRDALADVLAGIAAARAAGMRIKINMVALAGVNDDEFVAMARWCGAEGHDLSIIETMPLGDVAEDRSGRFLAAGEARSRIAREIELVPSHHRTAGPSRYLDAPQLGIRIGFISPLTENFCATCNRVRVTAEGRLYLCLGRDDSVDLRAAWERDGAAGIDAALDTAMRIKPRAHDFHIERPAVARHMSVTGG